MKFIELRLFFLIMIIGFSWSLQHPQVYHGPGMDDDRCILDSPTFDRIPLFVQLPLEFIADEMDLYFAR
jgi:hypothetical protein